MLDALLGRGFAAKCKSLIKSTKARIELIRRKRSAREKFLKKDIADLLANGLDENAFGRTEGLMTELTLSSCYDYVEECCDILYKKLSEMQKQSECPADCKEAVASLMFSAARVSDLPELRDLREAFQEKYGNSLQYCVNQKFVADLSSSAPTMEKKLQLMQAIAAEYSISWNCRVFEKQMSKKPVHGKTSGPTSQPGRSSNGREHEHIDKACELKDDGAVPSPTSEMQQTLFRTQRVVHTPVERLDVYQGNHKDNSANLPNASKSQDTDKLNARFSNKMIPAPPYVKPPKVVKAEMFSDILPTRYSGKDVGGSSWAGSTQTSSSSNRADGTQKGCSYEKETSCSGGHADISTNYNDSASDQSLQKPKSVRQHSSRSRPSVHDDGTKSKNNGNGETEKRSSSNWKKSQRKQGLQILFDDEHLIKDDERALHLSKKPASFDPEKLRRMSDVQAPRQMLFEPKPHVETKLKPGNSTPLTPHTRSVSLPHESVPPEPAKVFARASSFQPDRPAKHVHPNLPDCDDLAARIAALRRSY